MVTALPVAPRVLPGVQVHLTSHPSKGFFHWQKLLPAPTSMHPVVTTGISNKDQHQILRLKSHHTPDLHGQSSRVMHILAQQQAHRQHLNTGQEPEVCFTLHVPLYSAQFKRRCCANRHWPTVRLPQGSHSNFHVLDDPDPKPRLTFGPWWSKACFIAKTRPLAAAREPPRVPGVNELICTFSSPRHHLSDFRNRPNPFPESLLL